MQAEVQGQKITWLTPHALHQVLTDDVDFNVMLTILEFYEVTHMWGTAIVFVCFIFWATVSVNFRQWSQIVVCSELMT